VCWGPRQASVGRRCACAAQPERKRPSGGLRIQEHLIECNGRDPIVTMACSHASLCEHQLLVHWRNRLCQPLIRHVRGINAHGQSRLLQCAPDGCLALHRNDVSNAALGHLGATEGIESPPPASGPKARIAPQCQPRGANVLINHEIETGLEETRSIHPKTKERTVEQLRTV
jgi:hypothetical protein